MNPAGLPDFSRPFSTSVAKGYFCYQKKGLRLLPNRIGLAIDENERPALNLELVRSSLSFGSENEHGILSVQLQPEYDFESVTQSQIDLESYKPLHACQISRGLIYFETPADFEMLETASGKKQDFEFGSDINTSEPNRHRMIRRLNAKSGVFWKELILNGTLLLNARISYLLNGVTPRVPLTAKFDPNELLPIMQSCIEQHLFKRELTELSFQNFVDLIQEHLVDLPVVLTDTNGLPQSLQSTLDQDASLKFMSESLADRLLHRFGGMELHQRGFLKCWLDFTQVQDSVRIEWDLSQIHLAQRVWSLSLSPFSEGSNLSINERRALITETELPLIQADKCQVSVFGNLAKVSNSVLAIQATLFQAASPPDRPVQFQKTVNLRDQDRASAFLYQLNDGQLSYTYATNVVLNSDRGTQNCRADALQSDDRSLVLGPQSFAIKTFSAALDANWVGRYEVEISLNYEQNGDKHTLRDRLDDSQSERVFLLPIEAEGIHGMTTLTDRETGVQLRSVFEGAAPLTIGPFVYPQCGQQQVEIQGNFEQGRDWLAVELEVLDHQGVQVVAQVVHLTPTKDRHVFSWYSHDPFNVAYRYRELDQLGNPSHDWIKNYFPFSILRVGATKNQHSEPDVVTGSR